MSNKGLVVFFISILSIVVVGLIVLMIFIIKGDIKISNISFGTKNELIVDEEYEENFDKISIDTSSSDIVIKESTSDKIRVVVYGDKERSTVKVENNELIINSKPTTCIGFCFNRQKADIQIYLPSDYSNKMNFKTKSGDINIDKFKNANIDIDLTSGDIDIKAANEVIIKSTSGDVELGNVKYAKIKSTSGDIDIDEINEFSITSTSGDIYIKNVDMKNDSDIKSTSGDVKIGSINDIYVDAKAKSGSVKIKDTDRKADLVLTIRTTSGDIIVK